jgi:leucine dehydrogenase
VAAQLIEDVMTAIWDLPDFDYHESVQMIRDADSGLTAVLAVHSTALGPAAGGTRFWHYPDNEQAIVDALRLSRGMSFKNAMAGLPMGGGKAVILSDAEGTKTPAMLTAFGRAIEALDGRYVTAQDVGMTNADLVTVASATRHITGLPVAGDAAGGDSGPATALGVYLGIKAAAKRALGAETMRGVHVAIQGIGSVGGGVARLLAADGARLTLADVSEAKAAALAAALGAEVADADAILGIEADVLSPCALGAVLTPESIAALKVAAVAGGANNQLAAPEDGDALHARGILYAPDYVINAGGIINVALQYFGGSDKAAVEARVAQIPVRLESVWAESATSGEGSARVADRMAQALIGR